MLLCQASIAVAQTSPCYWSTTYTKCYPSSGLFLDSRKGIFYGDSTTNYVQLRAPSSVTSYNLTLPSAQGAASTFLQNDGSGGLSWASSSTGSIAVGETVTGGTDGSILLVHPASTLAQDNSTLFWDATNHRLGLGTTQPANRLDVSGAAAHGSYAGTAAPTNGLIISGNVGIGTTTPVNSLDAANSIAVGSYAGGTTAPANSLIVSSMIGLGTGAPTYALDERSSITASSGAALANSLTPTLTAAANSDVLTGLVLNPTYADAGKTSVTHVALNAAGGKFTVGGAGDLTKVNNVTTSFPASQGSNHTTLHNDGSGNLTWALSTLTTDVTGTLPIANGGTGQTTATAAFNALSPLTSAGDIIYGSGSTGAATRLAIGGATTVLHGGASAPAYSAVADGDLTGQVGVAHGGTGIASGTSGGIPYYSGSTTIASSGALTANGIVLGGGAGATPTATAACTTASRVLVSGSPPSCGQITASGFFSTGAEVTQSGPGVVLSAGQLLGTNTTGDANSGYVGQRIDAFHASGSLTSISSATATNLDNNSIPAGDWELSGTVCFDGLATVPVITIAQSWFNLNTSATSIPTGTSGTDVNEESRATWSGGSWNLNTSGPLCLVIAPFRVSLSGSVIYALGGKVTFTGGTVFYYTHFHAVRTR